MWPEKTAEIPDRQRDYEVMEISDLDAYSEWFSSVRTMVNEIDVHTLSTSWELVVGCASPRASSAAAAAEP